MTPSRTRWMSLLATLSFLITYPSIYVVIFFRTSERLSAIAPNVEMALNSSIRLLDSTPFVCRPANSEQKRVSAYLTAEDVRRMDNEIVDAEHEFGLAGFSPSIADYTYGVLHLGLDLTHGIQLLRKTGIGVNHYLFPPSDSEYSSLCSEAAEREAARARYERLATADVHDEEARKKILTEAKDEIDQMVNESVGPHSEEERREIEAAGQKAVQEHKAKLQEFQREFHKGLEEHRTRRWGIAAIALLDVLILLGGYVCAAIVIRQWLRDRRDRDRAGAAK